MPYQRKAPLALWNFPKLLYGAFPKKLRRAVAQFDT
jgi:hypothetical protein